MSQFRPIAVTPERSAALSPAAWLALYAVAIALVPPAVSAASGGLRAIFDYLAADSFVYLSVAGRSTHGFYTFDGTHATNGFHPLWQTLLKAVFQLGGIALDKARQIETAFWLSVALVTAGGLLTVEAVRRWTGSAGAAMLAFPGLFGLVTLICGWNIGTPWRFMNGMETPASLFFFGLLLLYLSGQADAPLAPGTTVERGPLLALSLIMTGIVFSRLDDIFLPAVVVGWLLLRREAPPVRRIEAVLWFGLPLGAAILAYLVANHLAVGHAMPVSGAAKFDLRTPTINVGFLGSSLHALVPDFLHEPFSRHPGDVRIENVNWRNVQMLLPVIVARLLLRRMDLLRLDGENALTVWMRPLLYYVMVKGSYNFLFVPLLHQGHWYYSLSITIINIAAAVLAVNAWRRWTARGPGRVRLGTVAGATTVASLLLFTQGGLSISAGDKYFDFFRRGPAIAEALEASLAAPRIVEADDGIVNYALGLPTMSGFLFAIDTAGYEAFKRGDFLAEASRRGYQLIGSLHYFRSAKPEELTPGRIPDMLREKLFNATSWDLDRFDFSLEYRDPKTGAVFIRFTPKRCAARRFNLLR